MTEFFKNRTETFFGANGLDKYEIEVRSIIGQHAPPHFAADGQRPGMVHSIVLHQTGCPMPGVIQGWCRLNAHLGITSTGKIYWINNPVDFIWHAQGLSPLSIGIEVEGNWFGIEGDKKTLWKGGGQPASMTTDKKNAIMFALNLCHGWIMEQKTVSRWERITRAKPAFKGAFAHRQSSAKRENDCGQALYAVVDEFNKSKLTRTQLQKCREFHCGKGKPVPGAWYNE